MHVDIDNVVRPLRRVELGKSSDEDGKRREAFIQNLVHDHPTLIPMAEIEPAFSPLIPVCKELPTAAGYVDNFWITPWGGIVLGEAKLVRNPQARREVVAQALDYARAVTSWTYEDLQDAARKALKQPDFTFWSLVEAESDLDEGQFVDAVQRRLSSGRLLVLIIGDGIQEGVEALTAHLQLHAGLHVGLALVDLSLWRDINGGLIVVPRVPMRTLLVERGIVRIEAERARVDPPGLAEGAAQSATAGVRAITPSEGEYFIHLETKRPGLAPQLKSLLSDLITVGIRPETGRTVKLLFSPTPDTSATAGHIESNGKIWFQGAAAAATRLGQPEAGTKYLEAMAMIIGGQIRHYEKTAPEVIDQDGRGTDIVTLIAHKGQWLAAIAELISSLASACALPDRPE